MTRKYRIHWDDGWHWFKCQSSGCPCQKWEIKMEKELGALMWSKSWSIFRIIFDKHLGNYRDCSKFNANLLVYPSSHFLSNGEKAVLTLNKSATGLKIYKKFHSTPLTRERSQYFQTESLQSWQSMTYRTVSVTRRMMSCLRMKIYRAVYWPPKTEDAI